MRLDKYLSDVTVYSRSQIKDLIREKRIKVDGAIVKDSGLKVDGNIVMIDDTVIEYVEYEYYLLNKPQGYICALEDNRYPVVMELIQSVRKDLAVVGRLDLNTEGAILITNDGQLNHRLLSSKNHVDKKYYFQTDVSLPNNAKELLEKPMDLGDFITNGATFEQIAINEGYLTINQGKFHQVKRMLEKIGCTITYLQRVNFANLDLEGLMVGQYRPLTQEEIITLRELTK